MQTFGMDEISPSFGAKVVPKKSANITPMLKVIESPIENNLAQA
jgi:hypothetical protein